MKWLVSILFCMHATVMQAQTMVEGEIILQLKTGIQLSELDLGSVGRSSTPLVTSECLDLNQNIYLLRFEHIQMNSQLDLLRMQEAVKHAHPNYRLQYRNKAPDDPLFADQWHLQWVGFDEVWAQTTGGVTFNGDAIVIGVMESGLYVDHEDLSDILWTNEAEIADNDLDDDGNGYIDDYFGVSLDDGKDDHTYDPKGHGSSVIGVLGARSNNDLGVASCNWNVKIALFSNDDLSMANAIKAYSYFANLRQRYNDSGGRDGALIVATNSSFGGSDLFEVDAPIYCSMFDEMGRHGILSVGAAENNRENADILGDLPSNCSSNSLIIVTNTTSQDKLAIAGFGPTSVDLGAPGTRILTTGILNDYVSRSGTSYATPLVCGAIALLYSHPSREFSDQVITQPVQSAKLIKDLILGGVLMLEDLEGRVSSQGRLDVGNSYRALEGIYPANRHERPALGLFQNPVRHQLRVLLSNAVTSSTLKLYDMSGRCVREEIHAMEAYFLQTNVSQLPSGIYFLSVCSQGQSIGSVKFLKI